MQLPGKPRRRESSSQAPDVPLLVPSLTQSRQKSYRGNYAVAKVLAQHSTRPCEVLAAKQNATCPGARLIVQLPSGPCADLIKTTRMLLGHVLALFSVES